MLRAPARRDERGRTAYFRVSMNYAPITTDPVAIRLPRTLSGTPDDPCLTVIGTADRQQYTIPVTDFSADGLYYAMRGDFGAITTPGEYEYRLTDGAVLLASGIIRFGFTPNPKTDTYEIIPVYDQYNAD